MRSKNAKCRKKGFTLIELLVVIAIISLLVSILLPSLQKAKETANRSVCMSNLHNLCMTMHIYAEDYKGLFPPVRVSATIVPFQVGTSITNSAYHSGFGLLLDWNIIDGTPTACPSEYIPNLDLLFCPGDTIYRPLRRNGTGLTLSGPEGLYYNYTGYNYVYICQADHEDQTSQWYGMGRFSLECDPYRVIGMEYPHFRPEYWITDDGPFWHLEGRNYLRLGGSVFFLSEAELESKFDVYSSWWKDYLLFLEE